MAYQQNHNPFSPIAKGGLWANMHAKRDRGESPAQPGDKGYPTDKALKDSQSPSKRIRKTTTGKGRNFRKAKEGAGMTEKGVRAYRKANPGSKLKTAVTGKVKKGSKAAKRRKSFCARTKGWKGKRGRAARRRWKC